jgi:hypothetical protein
VSSESEIRTAFSLGESELLQSLGEQVTGLQAFPLQPEELAERGARWLKAKTTYLQECICSAPQVRSFATNDKDKDVVAVAIEVAKLLAGLVLPVNPVTLAVLIVKGGLKTFCDAKWKVSSAP